MKIVSLFSFVLIFSLLSVIPVGAKVSLPAIVSSNMVLQRNTTVTLWGWADKNERITVKASWLNDAFNIKADKDGNWQVEVKTTNSKEQQSIQITSNDSVILLKNILFGEVWICSGQSNMQQPLNGYRGEPTFGALEAIANSKNNNLRLFSVDRVGSKTPKKELEKFKAWEVAGPENVRDFSAVAYFFGQQLQEILEVPVGMIHTSWGGSRVEAWISKDIMSKFQEVDLANLDINKRTNHIPTALYNAMIHPLIPYSIKGVLWYQGESNRLEPQKYTELLPAMVKDWRTRWNIGDFPFYYVQIAPYMYDNDNEVFNTYKNSSFIREAQLTCLDLIPNSGIAITMDIGDDYCIHPPKKKEVADRLLFNALSQTYGFETIDGTSPVYESMDVKEGGIELKFKGADTGLFAYGELEGFEIAGDNKIFYPAEAKFVDGARAVMVSSEKVPNPVAVRYAWRNWIEGTLFDTNLLPASSFRTDRWDEAVRHSE